jgi:tetratricopeptide (TPR) repeat protein
LAEAHNNLGAALFKQGKLEEAVAAFREAIRLQPDDAGAHIYLGNALRMQGKLDEAVASYREAIRLAPKHAKAYGALGQALLQQGRFADARDSTRQCLEILPAGSPLRGLGSRQLKQCERLMALDEKLPAILKGEVKPKDADERLALAGLCQRYKQRYAAAARFYADAFAEQPRLVDDLRFPRRYNAACAAALAAAGKGKDADTLGDKERTKWRRQAQQWLNADLAAWTRVVQKQPRAWSVVQRTLTHWRNDPDLAGVRDKEVLAKLPEDERRQWQKFWAGVEALLARTGE